MHPTVQSEAELLALLPARCHSLVTSQLAVPATDLPGVGKMEDLLAIARTRCQLTKESSKARKQAERSDTAAWWEYGQVLDRIRTGCPHKGEWGEALKAIGETKKAGEPNYNRAEEAIKIFKEFQTKKEASKVSVRAALKRHRKNDANYNELADCFATPPDLWEVIQAEYNPTLDTFATPESALCRNFYCPDIEEFRNRKLLLNAFAQRWTAHCPNGVVYCNPPYNFLVLGKAVRMAWEQAQAGLTVVCLLPYFKSYDWYENVVKRYGERREIPGTVVCDGFGIQKGKRCGNIPGPYSYETMLVVFRRGQRDRGWGDDLVRPGFVPVATDSGCDEPPAVPPSLRLSVAMFGGQQENLLAL